MEVIRRTININNVSGDHIYFKVNITQKIKNGGLLTDMNPLKLINMDGSPDLEFVRNLVDEDFYAEGGKITYASDSKVYKVRGYLSGQTYVENFDIKKENCVDYQKNSYVGVDRVLSINDDEIKYTIGAKRDSNIGTSGQTIGITYTDYPTEGIDLPSELSPATTTTKVEYKSEGWNETNSAMDPQIQEDYLIGIISEPEVKSDVFIDRGVTNVLDGHLRLSEIENLDHLVRYGNGYYKINRN